MLEAFTAALPELLGGSADLTGSNLTNTSHTPNLRFDAHGKVVQTTLPGGRSVGGRHINYGVREFGMAVRAPHFDAHTLVQAHRQKMRDDAKPRAFLPCKVCIVHAAQVDELLETAAFGLAQTLHHAKIVSGRRRRPREHSAGVPLGANVFHPPIKARTLKGRTVSYTKSSPEN